MDILFFGGQSHLGIGTYISELVRTRRGSTLVDCFLASTERRLRQTIDQLAKPQQDKIPRFVNLEECIHQYAAEGNISPIMEATFLCIAQIADYLFFESTRPETPTPETATVGISVGSIASSTIPFLSKGVNVIEVASYAVLVTFRLALYIDEFSEHLIPDEQEIDRNLWALNITGVNKEDGELLIAKAIDRISKDHSKIIPYQESPYISAIWPEGITVSGPPPILEQLQHHLSLGDNVDLVPVRALGPYHAGHLHHTSALGKILDFDVLEEFQNLVPRSQIHTISLYTGCLYDFPSLKEAYKQVIMEILGRNQDISIALSGDFLPASRDCNLHDFGPIDQADPYVATICGSNKFSKWLSSVPSTFSCTFKQTKERIAIVGMSGRFPGAHNLDEFSKVLYEGKDMHREIPQDRFDANEHTDISGKGRNKSHTPYGCFIDDPGYFDPRFFNMSPREATQTDPMQRLALLTAYEALEMAGYVPNRTSSTKLHRIGTFYGQTSDDWREINEAQDIDTYFITGGVRAFGPGRINYHFGFSGPSLSIDTACSSSMAAIHTACNSLWLKDCDTAVVGGMNILTNPDIFAGLSKGQFLSKTGPCKTYDNDADGYCRGEAVSSLVLKRLSDAEEDHDNILGVILSASTNHSADAISITHPHAETQEFLYRRVLSQAGIKPTQVSYVEMHGTGTQAGDATEMESVLSVFAPTVDYRAINQKLYVGSVKANVGHGEASSGVTSIVKVLLMMRQNLIPPHIGIKGEINKGFPNLTARNTFISQGISQLPKYGSQPLRVFVNNFSAAGGNTAVVIEEACRRQRRGSDPRSKHVVAVSAASLSSLKKNIENLITYIGNNRNLHLPSLSYTTTARRVQHNYRFSIPSSDVADLEIGLIAAKEKQVLPVPQGPKIAFSFTGQGSMYLSAGADLFATCRLYRESLTDFNDIATSFGFPSFKHIVDGTSNEPIASVSPLLVQLAQTSIQMALTRLWRSLGVSPHVVIGHSLGEYAALFAAEVLSSTDVIFLVGNRAQLLIDHCTEGSHAMLAVHANQSMIEDSIPKGVEIVCVNSDNEIVLGGLCVDIESTKNLLQKNGLKCSQLSVPYAFHSSQVDSIMKPFMQLASAVSIGVPKCGYLSSALGRYLGKSGIDAEYLCQHSRRSVKFHQALNAASIAESVSSDTIFLEIGPHPVLSNFIRSTLGPTTTTLHSLNRNSGTWETIAQTLSTLSNRGSNIQWSNYHRDFENALELLDLPSYAWSLSNHWIDYKNNWCLTKGLYPSDMEPVKPSSFIRTSTVHRIIEENFSETSAKLVAEVNISEPGLKAVLHGHMVNGVALCPSTLYADIGITIGQYMHQRMFPVSDDAEGVGMDVRDMEVPKTLIFKDIDQQLIQVSAEALSSKQRIRFTISSDEGEHAMFNVEFGKRSVWLSEWEQIGYLVESRMEDFRRAENSDIHAFRQAIAYKLFSTFVEYDNLFQGMKKVYLNSTAWEATADIVLEPTTPDQTFVVPPYWIDSIGHLSGFIMNVQLNENGDSGTNVFVSHGWESFRIGKTIMPGITYRTYVRMRETDKKNIVSGDVYCLEGSRVIALFEGVKFMRIPRRILDQVLPRSHSSTSRPVVDGLIQQTHQTPMQVASEVHVSSPIPKAVSIVSQSLTIIAQECGLDESELADPNSFNDLGVDSLMQLAITSRMREEIEIEVSSNLFMDYPTVADLKVFLRGLESVGSVEEDDVDVNLQSSSVSSNLESSNTTGPTLSNTPVSGISSVALSMANGFSNLKDDHIQITAGGVPVPIVLPLEPDPMLPGKLATSFLLQGNPKTASIKLFLCPDGSGSASSYAQIPAISTDVVVYGLNSPFMTTPQEYTCGVTQISSYYIQEIRRRQPHGPYNLGGWSAGGVIAFEAAQQLIRLGEVVDRLILIDSPCPLVIEPLPISLHQWFNTLGLLGDGDPKKIPVWLLPHFQASINALSTYNARAIDPSRAPMTFIIWCEDGVCKNPSDPRPSPYPYGHAEFLLENKDDLGPQLWDAMIGIENIRLSHVPGNHFTMMKPPFVSRLGEKIQDAFK